MATLLMDKFTAAEVKKQIKALNATPGITEMASLTGGKEKLGNAFLAAIEQCGKDGIVDDIAEPVWAFYKGIVTPDAEENATGGTQGGDTAKENGTTATEPADDPEPTKPKTPKPKKATRGEVFANMLKNGELPAGTRKQWAALYLAKYGGSENEAAFRVNVYCDLLVHMGVVRARADNLYEYTG